MPSASRRGCEKMLETYSVASSRWRRESLSRRNNAEVLWKWKTFTQLNKRRRENAFQHFSWNKFPFYTSSEMVLNNLLSFMFFSFSTYLYSNNFRFSSTRNISHAHSCCRFLLPPSTTKKIIKLSVFMFNIISIQVKYFTNSQQTHFSQLNSGWSELSLELFPFYFLAMSHAFTR